MTHPRRRFTRFPVSLVGQIKASDDSDWQDVEVVTVSTRGACAVLEGAFFIGDLVEIKVPPINPMENPRHAIAKVVWCHNGRVGLEYMGQH
jgi:hypothetical protein